MIYILCMGLFVFCLKFGRVKKIKLLIHVAITFSMMYRVVRKKEKKTPKSAKLYNYKVSQKDTKCLHNFVKY